MSMKLQHILNHNVYVGICFLTSLKWGSCFTYLVVLKWISMFRMLMHAKLFDLLFRFTIL